MECEEKGGVYRTLSPVPSPSRVDKGKVVPGFMGVVSLYSHLKFPFRTWRLVKKKRSLVKLRNSRSDTGSSTIGL